MLFKAPPDFVLEWDTQSLPGMQRWLQRIWTLVYERCSLPTNFDPFSSESTPPPAKDPLDSIPCASHGGASLRYAAHTAIATVTACLESTHSFNVAVNRALFFSSQTKKKTHY